MHPPLPVQGAIVWIRQTRWRVEHARRERHVLRLDVVGRSGRLTFLAPPDRPAEVARTARLRRARPQHALARLARLIGRAHSYRSLATLIDARLDLLPHQLEPALAVQDGARRVLIADEVGLGKTIQAGLIVAELRRRHPAFRALVIAPSGLHAQWADELRARFLIDSRQADAEALGRLTRSGDRDENPWGRTGVWIASIDYLKQPHVFSALPGQPWDLIVVDEAHGACGHSERHTAAAHLTQRARRVVLLTATPHSGDAVKFERLESLGALPSARDELVVFRRTRRELALSLTRRVRWHGVRLSLEETQLLDALASFERAVLQAAGELRRPAALLLLTVFRKRALSTTSALLISLERRLSWLPSGERAGDSPPQQARLAFEDADDVSDDERTSLGVDVGLGSGREQSWLRRLVELARAAARRERKVACVLSLVRRTAEPVAIFTEFRDSLSVLRRWIEPSRAVAVLHGGLTPDEQRVQLNRFLQGSAPILLATDVASQGLNLQARCRWIINLELPWNPARIEQRAGRVDRIGQRRPVHVTLLVARHAAEAGVLAHLARRTLSAQQRFGSDILQATAPDERVLQAHLLAGAPLGAPTTPARPIEICRAWARPARAAARQLQRQRVLADRGRGPEGAGRGRWTRTDRSKAMRPLVDGAAALFMSVPLLDRSGATIEQRVVALRVVGGLRDAPIDVRALLAAARPVAERLMAARARRLQRLRQQEAALAAARERALAGLRLREIGRGEIQEGLFDRREARRAEDRARLEADVRRDLSDRLSALDDAAVIDIGSGVIELVFGSSRS